MITQSTFTLPQSDGCRSVLFWGQDCPGEVRYRDMNPMYSMFFLAGGEGGGSKAGSNNCLKGFPQMSQVLLVRFLKSYLNPVLSFVKSSTKEAASGLTATGAFAVLSSSLVKRQ